MLIRRIRTGVATGLAAMLLATASAAAADPDVEPPITMLDQLDDVGWVDVDVTFRAHPPGDAVTFECKLDAGPWEACTSPWHLIGLSEGIHDVAVRATDLAGNTDPTPETDSFLVDLSGPVGQLAINDGAASTGRSQVRLSMDNSDLDKTLQIRISNSPEVDAQGRLVHAWEGYEWQFSHGDYGWDLARPDAGGTSGAGQKSVYLQFFDRFGNVGPVTSDSILLQPGVTPVIVRLGATENPAEAGGYVGIRATVEAADGANIRDGMFRLVGCPNGESPYMWGAGQRRISLMCWGWDYPVGTLSIQAEFNASSELEQALASMPLRIGPASDQTPPRIFLTPTSSLDDGDPQELITVHSSADEAVDYDCRIDGGPWVDCGPTWTVPRPAPGAHVLEARGRDRGGRWSVVNAVLVWRVGGIPSGHVTIDDISINAGFPTRDPTVTFTIDPSEPAPMAVRISSSLQLDASGRLAKAIEVANPTQQTLVLDVEDPATGGAAGDGRKWLIHQWRAADGTWEAPVPIPFRVDRDPPTLRLALNANEPFVDDSEILVLPKSDESHEITVSYWTGPGEGSPGPLPAPRYDGVWLVGATPPGTIRQVTLYARATDLAGNRSPITSATITIDRSSPTSALYAPAFTVGSRVTTTSIPIKVGGTTKDTGSGVAKSTLQEAVGAGSFASIATTGSTSVTDVRSIKPSVGRTYRLRATDRLGHVGAWRLGPTVRPYLRDETSAAITYGPGWRRVSASPAIGSDIMRSATAGARFDFRFTGRAVAIIAPKRSSLGRARVYLDGKYVRTVDLRSSTSATQRVVFAAKWTTPGTHRLTVKVVGTGGRPFDLDAIAVVP